VTVIRITDDISIDESEITFEFVRASGPGGQNVNKLATAVQLRFDIHASATLPDEVKQRLITLGGQRVSKSGVLIIDARRFRTQERNRQDALDRFSALVKKATFRKKRRRPTAPSRASKERRLDEKRRKSQTKRLRKDVGED
jgi:ribosome-associated protein